MLHKFQREKLPHQVIITFNHCWIACFTSLTHLFFALSVTTHVAINNVSSKLFQFWWKKSNRWLRKYLFTLHPKILYGIYYDFKDKYYVYTVFYTKKKIIESDKLDFLIKSVNYSYPYYILKTKKRNMKIYE